ncbi:gamma carbonic anhydrase family protein [Demequina lignilytica]|uniref:Gamma carbonic anhydrase family protein n=1 Tax=Demequina lignilytica TaxID=3051663 RepID=A0AB35MJY9_9MICO|nr:gamma carbonic anhydrase family protein [Demequina sp. SYSU T0a273]MDN4484101.1 gamma carbonic anhydrase family protein [Demequina sp. SYSU T0a273]
MILTHRGKSPTIDPTATVAPTAVVCGDVRVGPGARILHGAVLTAEDGQVSVGEDTVVMENALVKARAGHDVRIGDAVVIGPHVHVNGAEVGDECFIATGAAIFPGAVIEHGCEVRIRGVVQVNTRLTTGTVLPIGWIAVGTPAAMLPPERHEEVWAIQQDLDFSGTVYGVDRTTSMRELLRRQSEFYGAHADDEVIG